MNKWNSIICFIIFTYTKTIATKAQVYLSVAKTEKDPNNAYTFYDENVQIDQILSNHESLQLTGSGTTNLSNGDSQIESVKVSNATIYQSLGNCSTNTSTYNLGQQHSSPLTEKVLQNEADAINGVNLPTDSNKLYLVEVSHERSYLNMKYENEKQNKTAVKMTTDSALNSRFSMEIGFNQNTNNSVGLKDVFHDKIDALQRVNNIIDEKHREKIAAPIIEDDLIVVSLNTYKTDLRKDAAKNVISIYSWNKIN